jgi:hypothetical protein
VEDHHVDRPDVEAWQRVQLTGTNRSFDLIALVAKARDLSVQSARALCLGKNRKTSFASPFFAGLVAFAR